MTLSRLFLSANSWRYAACLAALCIAGAATSHASGAATAAEATVSYRKIFPGSVPEYVEIRIGQNQSATFDIRQIADPPDPQPLEVRAQLRARIFELAAELHNFDGIRLDVHRRLANLGQKTFRYESGTLVHETTFNYTMDPTATQLLDIFEGFSRQQVDLQAIQHSMRYDRLGINDALLQFQTDLDQRGLPEPDCLLPTLDKLAADSRFLNMARERASALAGRIRASENLPPPAPAPPPDAPNPQNP
jgi:hypothetical protein